MIKKKTTVSVSASRLRKLKSLAIRKNKKLYQVIEDIFVFYDKHGKKGR